MYSTSDFRNGLKIELDGTPYIMTYFQHVKPGKGGAFVRTKLKNMLSGAVIEKTFVTPFIPRGADIPIGIQTTSAGSTVVTIYGREVA